jgi:hypothetical protein
VCTSKQKTCPGICVGDCAGTRTNASCRGTLGCSQNAECENACQAHSLLSTSCADSKTIEVFAVSDPALYTAVSTKGARLGKALGELALVRDALGFIRNRAYGDFVALHLEGDRVRACVKSGNDAVTAADAKFNAALQADPTVRKTQAK